MPVLHLTEAQVQEILTMSDAIPAVEAALRKISLEEAFNIPRSRCQTDLAMLHMLPAAGKTIGVLGYKAYVSTKKQTRFHVTIYDAKTGEMTGLLQADYLGAIRTGAASAVATKVLARENAHTLGIIGTGKQARTQLLGVAAVRKLTEVRVYSPNAEHRQNFVQEMSQQTGLSIVAVDTAEQAVRGMDIVCTATTAREPVLLGQWLSSGQHLNIIGSNFLAKTEIDLETIKRTDLTVIDSKDQGKIEAGDFVEALNAGILNWSDVAEIGQILARRRAGRETPEQITLFKSLGLGIEDIAVAAKVIAKAKEKGIGTWLEL
ncbi:MAG: ornithine cyclodeaminase family protein [Gemmataceae bacterium]|jgi:ornithine cyclodeaminase/alanine dehydrogenase-like protein (mu-crystallin family)|nr:ornithine cyclodeaminase family protein [Gemmataceae bacterium]